MESSQNSNQLLSPDDFFLDVFQLMSIPPTKKELARHEKHMLDIQKSGKKHIVLSAKRVVEVMEKALKIGITKVEFDVFKGCFHNRPYKDLGRSKFYNPKTREIDIEGLLDEIFDTASLFRNPTVRDYFLTEIQNEILDRYNEIWAATVFKINKKFTARLENLHRT